MRRNRLMVYDLRRAHRRSSLTAIASHARDAATHGNSFVAYLIAEPGDERRTPRPLPDGTARAVGTDADREATLGALHEWLDEYDEVIVVGDSDALTSAANDPTGGRLRRIRGPWDACGQPRRCSA